MSNNQVHFVKFIMDYIVTNGIIEGNKVFIEELFRSLGSITKLFSDKMQDVGELMGVIASVKSNCENII